jgi:hypothetical protein
MTIAFLCLALGVLLANVLPAGTKPGVKYAPLDEDDFQRMLAKRGLR